MDIVATIMEIWRDSGPYVRISSGFIVVTWLIFIILSKSDTISKNAPGILISLGIFFTFIGITYALYNFDPQNITRTIPELLEGLKLAFVSSVVGLATSILYRFFGILFKFMGYLYSLVRRSKKLQDQKTAADFYNLMENIRQTVEDGNNNIKEALVGDGEASLSTQITKLRADSHTNFNDLRNEFKEFAAKVVEDGSQQLIQALERVIRDFNQQINEQFGENFQKLNEAVGQLVIWQEQHKDQVEKLTDIFTTVQKGIESANESVNNIQKSTSAIPEHMEQIRIAFDLTNARMRELYGGLEALATIREKAEQAVPTIEGHLNQILEDLEAGAKRQRELITSNIEGIENLQQDFNNQIGDCVRKMTEELENAASIQRDTINESLKDFKNSQQQVTNAMNDYVQDIDKKMKEHITQAVNTMGNNLFPITEKLVNDYTDHQRAVSEELDKMNQRIRNRQN